MARRIALLYVGRAADFATRTGDMEYHSRCPACGEGISWCSGHGRLIGDPAGAAILAAHDDGDHTACHPVGCDERKAAR